MGVPTQRAITHPVYYDTAVLLFLQRCIAGYVPLNVVPQPNSQAVAFSGRDGQLFGLLSQDPNGRMP
jgi:hypothetical protein